MGSEKGALVLLLKVENLTYEADKRTILTTSTLILKKEKRLLSLGLLEVGRVRY